MRVQMDREAPFQSINGAAEITGLSRKYIREGVKSGKIPHIKVGSDYRINMKVWLDNLDEESRKNCW